MGKTLELAKNQGCIKSRKINNILKPNIEKSKQIFSHFLVIDFEATCWDRKPGPPNEVIEFPAVLMNVKGEVVKTFHHYVQPTEEPNLSEFCRNLTGISQSQVENAPPLGSVLMLFNTFLKSLNVKFNEVDLNNCAVVTWTDWDMKICLGYECKRKNLLFPTCLKSWIDLKLIYKKFYNRNPQGLNGALQEMGLKFQGRQHSGLCDAKNTGKLVHKMIQDGCILGLTKCLDDVKLDPKLSFDLELIKPMTTESSKAEPKTPVMSSTNRRGLREMTNLSNIRKTPPLCPCGRRSRFQVVSKPGPNRGRRFYSCVKGPQGCKFFQWESLDLGQSPAFKPPKKLVIPK